MRAPSLVLLLLALGAPALAAAQEDEDTYSEGPGPSEHHLYLSALGGTLLDLQSGHGSAALFGAEVSYSLPFIDVGILAQAYKLDSSRSVHGTTPVLLLRLEQSFETARGLDAVLAFGMGAARTRQTSWEAWFQFAIGLRLGVGPLFIAGELGFEQLNLFRLAAGIGVRI